ncbi:MAG TPA: hypothetical protein VIJ28_15670 [Chloroflexota bacterium]
MVEGGALGTGLGAGLASLSQLPFACAGPILGGVLADRLGIGVIFVLSLLLGVAGTWLVRRYVLDPRIEAAGQGTRGRSDGIIPEP